CARRGDYDYFDYW
nr:immunoglobulin heavy chain junction region [Mus musculus]